MILINSGSGQVVYTKVTNVTTGLPVTNDAANITAYISLDGGQLTASINAITEVVDGSSNKYGIYKLQLDSTETACSTGCITFKSTTSANYQGTPVFFETQVGIASGTYTFSTTGSIGSVTGNVAGKILGDIGTSITPVSIYATLKGNVGQVATPVNIYATHSGSTVGNVSGYLVGGVSGNVTGSTGSVAGNVSGALLGNIGTSGSPVSIYGNLRGSVGTAGNRTTIYADVEGNLLGDVAYNVGGDILGNIGTSGSPTTIFANVSGTVSGVTGNVNGYVIGGVSGAVGSVTNASSIVTATKAATYDGVTQEKLFEILLALLANKVTITTASSNTQTISYKLRDGTTEVLNITVSTDDGSRSTGGTIT
jgi:hypothetical protein